MPVPLDATAYVADERYVDELRDELGTDATPLAGRILLAPGPPRPASWAHNVWIDPVQIEAPSINAAAKALRALARNWVLTPTNNHRRAALISSQLPHVSAKPIAFPSPLPTSPLGSWTLPIPNLLIASPRCTSPFPNGEPTFVEDPHPPSRAYLKLWEALTLAERWPRRGELCVDLGSSPGGWTWVLATLGARVISVDKAPLAPRIAKLANVEHRRASAFGLDPSTIPSVDWLVSDIICYPARMLRLLARWLAVHPNARYVVTIKFKGAVDMAPLRAHVATHGGTLRHLHHNKHELTWTRLP